VIKVIIGEDHHMVRRKKTAPIVETCSRQTVLDGDVEFFKVNHSTAQAAFTWSDTDGIFTVIPGILPAIDSQHAIKISIVAVAKKGGK
jgi:hypothetical protein